MTTSTARKTRPPQNGANTRPLRRAAGLILLFNGLLVVLVLVKPLSDVTLALVVNAAQFIGPLLVLPLCFGGLLGRVWESRSLPGVRRTGGDERAALGRRLAWPGHPQLGFGTGNLHLLRVGAGPAATAALYRRCRLLERIPFLTVGHPAAACPPDSGGIPHPHRTRWPDDHDGSRHLQLVLHTRTGHAARESRRRSRRPCPQPTRSPTSC